MKLFSDDMTQQNRGAGFKDCATFAHLSSVTPDVKSGKMRISPFNGAAHRAGSAKSADPTCYNSASSTQESKMKSHDELFEEGNAAYHAGKSLASNPYERGTMLWCAWREGWSWGEAHAE